jgi:creatinine amidohydrolase
MGNVIEFSRLTWIDIEERLADDKRVVIPLGATEEHAYLSLATDTIVAEKVSKEACQRANVLLAPAMPFGCSAFAINYPGTISMRTQTMCNVVEDIIDCLYRQGFRRLIFVPALLSIIWMLGQEWSSL